MLIFIAANFRSPCRDNNATMKLSAQFSFWMGILFTLFSGVMAFNNLFPADAGGWLCVDESVAAEIGRAHV